MSGIVIRVASEADASALSALIQLAVKTTNAPDYSPEIISLICRNFTPDRVTQKMTERDVFAGFIEGRIVATVSFGRGKLHSLFVLPKFQGRGYGALLVAYLERHASKRGICTLTLSSSITARPFYEKLGYSVTKFEPRPDGSTFLMSKPIV